MNRQSNGKQPSGSIFRRIVWSIAIFVLVLVFFVGVNVVRPLLIAAGIAHFWQEQANAPVPANALRLVALGDSATMAIGADTAMEGFVGRIATYVQARTGRPVHMTNVSDGGATFSGVVQKQLPRVDVKTADLVIVACSNDMEQGVPLETYRAALKTLMQMLPASKTIISDLPLEPGRDAYQAILQELADAHHVLRADFARIFIHEGRRLDVFSWLPPHLNSKGYAYWFLAFQPEVDTILQRMKKQAS
jgi:lysophospholipase L1-like esterase